MRAIAGAQAQEKRAGLLHLRARCRGLEAAAVERARSEERSLVRGWLMRGTVHLVAREDYGWMLSLFGPRTADDSARRLGQLGLGSSAQQRALDLIRHALAERGPMTRSELAAELRAGDIELTPERRIHVMRIAVCTGAACIGPDSGGGGTLVATRDWLGELGHPDREPALAELARRYVGAFAPAGERDMAKWSGLPLGECRRGLVLAGGSLAELDRGLLVPRGSRARSPRSPLVRLLPAFDTYLMGYADRRHAVDPDGERRILPGGGVLRPTICVDGRLVGLWSSRRSGGRLEIELEPFAELRPEWHEALAREAADLGRFEGLAASVAG